MSEQPQHPGGQIVVYQTEDGRSSIRVRLEDETVWLSQAQMADLFEVTKSLSNAAITNPYVALTPEAWRAK